ncbi:hypothetical protein HanXRQr2_Chr05g0227341 [Helianthus annuus]|uniref:Uncharacterized protein n=1 Tax=Helianthus annuus TaxID=4232 RepID=A0A9K3J138_HELAN|nr:hypothetical protein HanXRQr2_Chr05g0227341 [Helianthus annuus]
MVINYKESGKYYRISFLSLWIESHCLHVHVRFYDPFLSQRFCYVTELIYCQFLPS